MVITIPILGSVGLEKDLPAHELPLSAITDSMNVRYRDGAAERFTGELSVFGDPLEIPYSLHIYPANSGNYVISAGLDTVTASLGITQTEITGTAPTGGIDDRWTGGSLNGVLVLNNGKDKPMYWGGDTETNLATLPDWDAGWICESIMPFKNYLVGVGWTKGSTPYPNMVKWSVAADPGTIPASWDETDPTLDAGEVDLAETNDIMIDSLPMGDVNIIYKSGSMYAQTYIGGQYIFQFRRLPGDTGMMARGCACVVPQGHLVLTPDDVIVHNGNGPQSILSGEMRRWLFSNIDATYGTRAFVVANTPKNEAWICFPETGSGVCTKALVWNYLDNTQGIRVLNNVTCAAVGQYSYSVNDAWSANSNNWNVETVLWSEYTNNSNQSRMLLGTTGPSILAADTGATFDGDSYTAMIERTGLVVGQMAQVKLVRSIVPRVDGVSGGVLYIQAGGAMDVEGEYTWSNAVTYVIGTTYKADLYAAGRFLAYRIYSLAGFAWRVRSIDIDVVPQGAY